MNWRRFWRLLFPRRDNAARCIVCATVLNDLRSDLYMTHEKGRVISHFFCRKCNEWNAFHFEGPTPTRVDFDGNTWPDKMKSSVFIKGQKGDDIGA